MVCIICSAVYNDDIHETIFSGGLLKVKLDQRTELLEERVSFRPGYGAGTLGACIALTQFAGLLTHCTEMEDMFVRLMLHVGKERRRGWERRRTRRERVREEEEEVRWKRRKRDKVSGRVQGGAK